MSLTETIDRRPLHHELVDRLRDMIIEGQLEPGQKISEKALCERFGVSRTPLREAVKILAAEGFLKLTPHRGASVVKLTLKDFEEALPIMGALDAVAGELACQNATEAEIAKLEDLTARMTERFEADDLIGYYKLNSRIHQLIMEMARNPTLTRSTRVLSERMRRARYELNMSPARWAQAVDEHQAMVKAIKNRKGVQLGRIMKVHVIHKLQDLQAHLFAEER
ncbi:GntR family transcriptional regulator [Pelagibius litoralis]|uniref:GntR family transcriptional regulator n=1 Tax=Pelagibius litoralis TaxID=374515 RepID=A0A967F0M1_9PROT|nr:GntR family transcriptional regulator [Pelagibius litoralis]NIA70817.1 GntR family transcriptional regulator [Pelagibius litoralis]